MLWSAASKRPRGIGGSRLIRRRADLLVVEQGLAESRHQAQALILAGEIWRLETRIEKPGEQLPADTILRLRSRRPRFVGRGGNKLEGALSRLGVDPEGVLAWDIGASTGGFTDCLLQHGAGHVVAVDVGRGQLDSSLRDDERVTSRTGINVRYLEPGQLPGPPSLVVADVSFISLEKVLPALCAAAPGAPIVALVKPQFEVGRGRVGHGGIVRDPALQEEALRRVCGAAARQGRDVTAVVESSLRGAEGNREFFVRLDPAGPGTLACDTDQLIHEEVYGDKEKENI
ncbi:MAG: TlyA family RNA methyltransferase [Acidobacteriota bacterium]